MEKFLTLIFIVSMIFVGVSCGDDPANIAWKNDSSSNYPISQIKWAKYGGDVTVTWSDVLSAGGINSTSQSQLVSDLTGSVGCLIDTGEPVPVSTTIQVDWDGNGDLSPTEENSYTLEAGSEKTYTMYVEPN